MWDAKAMKYLILDAGPIYMPHGYWFSEHLWDSLLPRCISASWIPIDMSTIFQSAAEEMAKSALAVEWVAAACVTCLLYDHILTVGQECSSIWPARLSVPKLLFLINRYIVEAMLVFDGIVSSCTHLSLPFCVFYMRWLAVVTSTAIIIMEGILTIRVWALYRSNKPVLCVACFFFFGGAVTLIGLTIEDYVGEPVNAVNDFNFLPGCYATSVPSIIAGMWIAPVIVESVLFALIIIKLFIWWKDKQSVPPLLVLMARDSAIYFAIYFALLIANLFVFEYGPPALDGLLVTPLNTGGCIAVGRHQGLAVDIHWRIPATQGSRMLLNLRGHADQTPSQMEMTATVIFMHPPVCSTRRHAESLRLDPER